MKTSSTPALTLLFGWFGMWICVALLANLLQAGEYSVTTWGVDEGLPQSSVTDIAQTPDGFLWISTLLSGLSRFDGVQFVNFDSANTPLLANPGVRHLFVDSAGTLWVNGGDGSLLRRQGNDFVKVADNLKLSQMVGEWRGRISFITIAGELVVGHRVGEDQWVWQRYKSALLGSNVNVYEDREGVIWFLVPGGKLGRFVNDHFETLEVPPGLAGSRIQALACDADGHIWVGTDTELARWEQGSFTNCNPGGAQASLSVGRILPVPGGRLWVEAGGKLMSYDHGQFSPPVPEWDGSQLPWSQLRSFRPDPTGGLWISLNKGIAHVSGDERIARVTRVDGLPSQWVQAFVADREGNLWAGYHRGGLVEVRRSTFHSVDQREGLFDTLVTSVTEDTAGAIWLGTSGGYVSRWSGGVCTNFTLPLQGRFCQDAVVSAGPDGRVWIGTGGNGLLVWDHGQFQSALLPDQIAQDGVRQLLITKTGEVWFANFSGLYRLQGTNLDRILTPNTTAQVVASLKAGSDGSLWMGTIGGELRHWTNGGYATYQPLDNMPASRFSALCPEVEGTVWVGTMNGGLLRFKDGNFTRFTTADGLADNSISHILADDRGNLWLGSHAGVICISKRDLVPRVERSGPIYCRLFGRDDGLPTVAMTLEFDPSCVKTHDDVLWFGTPKGATWVNPGNVRPAELPPPVLVESVRCDNQPRLLSKAYPNRLPPEITIEPGVNNLEVLFAAPVFTAPEMIRFKYRLEKLDPDWIDVGGRRSVTFNHLPAGDYTFRVTAGNSDGRWSQAPAAFRLIVLPYFWQRTSFKLLVLLVLLGGVALIVWRVTQQRLRRKLEVLRQQQQVDRERARIARDLHDDLGAGLTEISLTSDLAIKPSLAEDEARQYIGEIGSRAREMVQRMDEIVWAVNPRNDSVVSLSVYACQYSQQFLKPLDIACRLDVQADLPETRLNAEQRYNFFLAFKESVNNVARHSQATEMHLAIHAVDTGLVFLIEDNGRGFVAGSELAGADGLRNIRERIARIGGECEISSQPGQGTQVFMRVPLASQTPPSAE